MKTWLSAYQTLQNLGFNAEEADTALDAARKAGVFEIADCRIEHHPGDDTFDIDAKF